MDNNNAYEGMYQFDTLVFMALDLSITGKTHLAYRCYGVGQIGGIFATTLCGRQVYGQKIRFLPKVDILGAITTTPCLQCLKLALKDVPNSIKQVER